ncbi:MAG: general secretion pathway protein GspK [Silanimonas sp.]
MRREQGFILVVVLWLLAAIAIVASLVVWWSRQRVAEATVSVDALQDRIDTISTRDTLLFITATVPMTRGGLPVEPLAAADLARRRFDDFGGIDKTPRGGELRLDGTPYKGLGEIVVQVQDEAGLVSIASPDPFRTDALLQAAGIDRARRGRLSAALEDYVDEDDLRRLNGLEARDYERAGREPPTGRPLRAVGELFHVLGWDDLPASTRARIIDHATVGYVGALNLNTAPFELLDAMAIDCQARCRTRVALRDEVPFESGLRFELETGATLPGDRAVDFRVAPSDALRVTLVPRSGRAQRLHVRLTPLADRRSPWSIEAAYRVPRPLSDDVPRPIASPLFAPAPVD